MKFSRDEKAAHRAAFRNMSPAEKLDHVFTYYKWPILLGLAALVILGSVVHRQLTKRVPELYLGFTNVSVGEDLESTLTEDFLAFSGADGARRKVYLYRDLYLTDDAAVEDHQYAYASRMKLMGAVSARKMDLVLMNREAYDLLSRSSYLTELSADFFAATSGLYEQLLPLLTENEVVLSDNAIEYQLGEADSLELETELVCNAVNVSTLPVFAGAGFSGELYLGVIANSPRTDACLRYMDYLASAR